MAKMLGILGGLGPLASAEFVSTVYEVNCYGVEQTYPICVLYSDPSFPDRTDAILSGNETDMVNALTVALQSLSYLGVDKIVICCFTAHHFLSKLPPELHQKIISLIDIAVEGLLLSPKRYLLLCTNGARKAGIFQNHKNWQFVEPYIVLPDEQDQLAVHDLIYQVKVGKLSDAHLEYIDKLSKKYNVDSFIAGCTEIHLLTKKLLKEGHQKNYSIEDPLMSLALNFDRYLDENYSFSVPEHGESHDVPQNMITATSP